MKFRIVAGKAIIFLFSILLVASLTIGHAQNTWTQKADFAGVSRQEASGFAIGNKAYIGTGWNGNSLPDFWEWDPAMDAWTQKEDYGGGITQGAFHFSIGTKGYIVMGYDQTTPYPSELWEWNQTTNLWTQKANFPGMPREDGASFAIGNKGYIGCGGNPVLNDFWEWDQASNTWTKKAKFGGAPRLGTIGFSIGSKGYIGVGHNGNTLYKDFWEYDPSIDTWIQRADFGGAARSYPFSFSIGTNGYIGTGWDEANNFFNDVWAWDQNTNTWTQQANFGGGERSHTIGFSLNGKGYIGTGYDGVWFDDFWEYTPAVSEPPCNIPTSLSTIDITSTTAKLKWHAVGGALSYKVRYKIAGTSEWTITKALNNNKSIHGLAANIEYTWQVKSFCDIQPVVASDWSEKQFFTTDDLRLSEGSINKTIFEIYPNPLSSSATVSFFLTEESNVTIELMDVNGRSLRVITNNNFSSGTHAVTFNRESLVAGIYFLQLKTNAGVMMKNMVIE